MRKIGLFGGTFDPIHNGHIKVAQTAIDKIGLDMVIFIPSGQPPHKTKKQISDKQTRLEMTQLAIQDIPYFKLSDYELDKQNLSYSVETVKHFLDEYPGDTFYFIVGADSFSDLPTWYGYRDLMELCCFVVISRPDTKKEELLARFEGNEKPPRVFFIDDVFMDISSTQIREMVAEGNNIIELVPIKIYEYIIKKSLYRE